jgi:hypothetical protein
VRFDSRPARNISKNDTSHFWAGVTGNGFLRQPASAEVAFSDGLLVLGWVKAQQEIDGFGAADGGPDDSSAPVGDGAEEEVMAVADEEGAFLVWELERVGGGAMWVLLVGTVVAIPIPMFVGLGW